MADKVAEVDWDLNIPTQEYTIQTGDFQTWYRVWGSGPLKALFLHGGTSQLFQIKDWFLTGPGQAVDDYEDVNFKILNPNKYTVVEIDQLGTGKSEPSVRKGLEHAKLFIDVRAQEFVEAMCQVLDKLGWDKVFLHGRFFLFFSFFFSERNLYSSFFFFFSSSFLLVLLCPLESNAERCFLFFLS